MGGRIRHRRPDQVPPRALPGRAGRCPGSSRLTRGCGRRRPCRRWRRRSTRCPCWCRWTRRDDASAGTAATSRNGGAFAGTPNAARVPSTSATRATPTRGGGRRRLEQCDSCCGHRCGACRRRGSGAEGPVPERRARVVVDRNHVVVARHDGKRRKQRDAVDGDALHGGLHAPLAFEFGFPLQLEAGFRERVDRDVRIGPQPVRALRVALRGRPFVADIA